MLVVMKTRIVIKTSLLASAVIAALLPGCTSDDTQRPAYVESFVAGYVHNNGTPAAGVQVDLMGGHWDGGIPAALAWEVLASTCTADNGYFSFNYRYKVGGEFGLDVHSMNPGSPQVKLQPGDDKHVNLEFGQFDVDSIAAGTCR
jgi:hypothetical protein